jgi:hypothetical protein
MFLCGINNSYNLTKEIVPEQWRWKVTDPLNLNDLKSKFVAALAPLIELSKLIHARLGTQESVIKSNLGKDVGSKNQIW